MSTKIYRSTCF